MNSQAKILVGGFAFFLASGFINQFFQATWLLYAGCGAFAIPFLLFVVFPMVVFSTVGDRRNAEADMHRYAKEAGLEPYTHEELKQMEAEERSNHNNHSASASFWAGSDTYIDYDGNVRDVETDQPAR